MAIQNRDQEIDQFRHFGGEDYNKPSEKHQQLHDGTMYVQNLHQTRRELSSIQRLASSEIIRPAIWRPKLFSIQLFNCENRVNAVP